MWNRPIRVRMQRELDRYREAFRPMAESAIAADPDRFAGVDAGRSGRRCRELRQGMRGPVDGRAAPRHRLASCAPRSACSPLRRSPAGSRADRDVRPEAVLDAQGLRPRAVRPDLAAGVIVGIVAIPLAIAFAIASGVTPGRGLWTAIVAGFLISALGGSRVQIGGPTGAFVVIVYGIVQKYGVDGLTVATLMAGVLLVMMGFAKLGSAIKFIPHPVITGFTSGIAVIIFSSQVKDFLGLRMGAVPAEFVSKWVAFADQRVERDTRCGRCCGGLARRSSWSWPRISRSGFPAPFVALVVGDRRRARGCISPSRRSAAVSDRSNASVPHPQLPHLSVAEVTGTRRPRVHDRDARRDRVAPLGRGRGRNDRRPAPLEHGTGGARRREHRVADVRRHPRDRGDRADRDEHQERRPHASRRDDARGHAAARHAVLRPVRGADPAGRRSRRFSWSWRTT